MYNKPLALFLIIALILSLFVGCVNTTKDNTSDNTSDNTTSLSDEIKTAQYRQIYREYDIPEFDMQSFLDSLDTNDWVYTAGTDPINGSDEQYYFGVKGNSRDICETWICYDIQTAKDIFLEEMMMFCVFLPESYLAVRINNVIFLSSAGEICINTVLQYAGLEIPEPLSYYPETFIVEKDNTFDIKMILAQLEEKGYTIYDSYLWYDDDNWNTYTVISPDKLYYFNILHQLQYNKSDILDLVNQKIKEIERDEIHVAFIMCNNIVFVGKSPMIEDIVDSLN